MVAIALKFRYTNQTIIVLKKSKIGTATSVTHSRDTEVMKRIAIFNLCFLAFFIHSGCSKGNSSEKRTSTEQPKSKVNTNLKTGSPVPQASEPDTAQPQEFVAVTNVMGEWQCVTQQDVMKLNLEESFGDNGRGRTEGIIEFIVPNGPSLNLYIKGESRWALQESKLCDTPVEVTLTQTSGAPSPLVDQLLAGMRKQAKARIEGKLMTCRAITEVTPTSMVLKTLDSAIETKCKRKVKTP